MADKGLLEIAHRLVTDAEFRELFLISPAETLADLGVSAEAYRALVAMAPILLAGGVVLVDGIANGGIRTPQQSWGRK